MRLFLQFLFGTALLCCAACDFGSNSARTFTPPRPSVEIDYPEVMTRKIEGKAVILEDEEVRILLLPSTPQQEEERQAKTISDVAQLRELGHTAFQPPVDFAAGKLSGKKFARIDEASGKARQVQYLLMGEPGVFFVEMLTQGPPFDPAHYEEMLGTLRMAE